MKIIEPCCAVKQFLELRNAIGKNSTTMFEGFGDLSLTELLPALLTRYSGTRLLIAAPQLPEQATDIISKWMKKTWMSADGKGRLDVIRELVLITPQNKRKSPEVCAWQKENPFPGRLRIVDKLMLETVILLPDLAILGPVNMQYGSHFYATVTSRPGHVDQLWRDFLKVAEPEPAPEPEPEAEPEEEAEQEKPETEAAPGDVVKEQASEESDQ